MSISTFGNPPIKREGEKIRYDGMANRSSLHVNKLGDFTLWLMAHGWQYKAPKGDYEVLRMWHNDYALPLLVYKRYGGHLDERQHLTLQGMSEHMYKKWKKSLNGEREKGRADRAAAVVETSKSL